MRGGAETPAASEESIMGLFKEVKKPVIKHGGDGGGVSGQRPSYAAKTAPCIHSCPSGTDVRGWLVQLAQHKDYGRTPAQAFETAWRTILENNPFPAICGRVCQHPCELNCNRKGKDGAVEVNRLEQFLGDFAIAQGLRAELPAPRDAGGRRVAVVGAGPAGLAAAYHLTRKGYAVTVFDAAPQPGGMMRYRIPRSVIPAATLDAEIGNILALGVELRSSTVVGRDVSLEELKHGYQVVFFAMGVQKTAQLELRPGDEGQAAVIGALPAELPEIPAEEPRQAEMRQLNMVSPAIGQGRAVAEAIASYFHCCTIGEHGPKPAQTVIRADKVKLDWYPAAPRLESAAALTEAEVIAQAARCMSCGMCMDCETCWMYCSKNCFVKLPKGEHYKIKLELCNGCGKCAASCPCGYIEMS
jgi:Pyruvate/2-oxoacid:ferredoxin oxidoreductase delta subunit